MVSVGISVIERVKEISKEGEDLLYLPLNFGGSRRIAAYLFKNYKEPGYVRIILSKQLCRDIGLGRSRLIMVAFNTNPSLLDYKNQLRLYHDLGFIDSVVELYIHKVDLLRDAVKEARKDSYGVKVLYDPKIVARMNLIYTKPEVYLLLLVVDINKFDISNY